MGPKQRVGRVVNGEVEAGQVVVRCLKGSVIEYYWAFDVVEA